ncbi:DUF4397 domain-containing protein [Olivibacter ginsenosidimutans]
MKLKKNLVLLMTVLVGSLAFSACNDNDDGGYTYVPQSVFQIINAYPHADEGLGFALGQQKINLDGPLKYGEKTVYIGPIVPNQYDYTAGISGTDTPILDTTITLKDSTYHTSIIYGPEGSPNSIFVDDKQPSDFDQSKANVRFFNVADNTVPLDVNLIGSGEPINVITGRGADNQSTAKQNQVFKPVATGVYTIQFTDESGEEVAKKQETVTLNAGGYYTIIARGIKGNTNKPLTVGFVDHFPQQ